ncbi:MarR family transcriptional regulator [Lactobacillus alvi]|uniref:MarR family transcriptional regulator n=1 Tax=Limosilactobacillus alvi TaxID=990412 RepID=A0ABS2EQ59_9LACO|nr:MarR family transcriptional regulator [Limosilactobacillus alvi]MBM6754365.1 MarR family transcriptional regulator [Limosilactobacillus alvi]
MITILREIGTIARALDSIANVECKQHQLARGQYLYLVRIAEQPGIIADQLSKLLKVDRATVSRAVSKLVAQKLVVRQTDTQNQRLKHLYVTELGRARADLIERENQYSERVAQAGLSASEQAQLKQLLERVAKNVGADWEQVKAGRHREY